MAATFNVPVLGETSLLQLVSNGLALLILSVFIRQRYFSIISDIPGPFLGTFGTCFQLWEICRGRINERIAQLHQKHGTSPFFESLPPANVIRTLCADQLQRSQRQPPGSYTSPRGATLEIRLVQTLRGT